MSFKNSPYLSDYDKTLLDDPNNVLIVKIKGKGAGAETMQVIPRSTWNTMEARDKADWKDLPTGSVKKTEPAKEAPKQKTEEEILSEIEASNKAKTKSVKTSSDQDSKDDKKGAE